MVNYTLRPKATRIIITIKAITKSKYSKGPRLNATNPINHRMTRTAATTNSKSNKPIVQPRVIR